MCCCAAGRGNPCCFGAHVELSTHSQQILPLSFETFSLPPHIISFCVPRGQQHGGYRVLAKAAARAGMCTCCYIVQVFSHSFTTDNSLTLSCTAQGPPANHFDQTRPAPGSTSSMSSFRPMSARPLEISLGHEPGQQCQPYSPAFKTDRGSFARGDRIRGTKSTPKSTPRTPRTKTSAAAALPPLDRNKLRNPHPAGRIPSNAGSSCGGDTHRSVGLDDILFNAPFQNYDDFSSSPPSARAPSVLSSGILCLSLLINFLVFTHACIHSYMRTCTQIF